MCKTTNMAMQWECDFQEKPKGTLPHFSLLLPVAVELPHQYLKAFLENHTPGTPWVDVVGTGDGTFALVFSSSPGCSSLLTLVLFHFHPGLVIILP